MNRKSEFWAENLFHASKSVPVCSQIWIDYGLNIMMPRVLQLINCPTFGHYVFEELLYHCARSLQPKSGLCVMLLIGLVKTSVMESARVAFASSVRIEQHRNQQKCRGSMNMSYACPLDCVEYFLYECVHAAVQQQVVHLEHESSHTYTRARTHKHTHGPSATGTADSTSGVTCVYPVSSVPPLPELSG